MRKHLCKGALFLFFVFFAIINTKTYCFSAGTPAGTIISNKVNLLFDYGDKKGIEVYAESSMVVDNKVNVNVTNIGSTTVLPGEKQKTLLFTLTNTGNASQRYRLEARPVYSPENVELTNIKIYLDSDNSGTFTTGDILYVNPESFGDIIPDKTLKIMIVADVPDNLEDNKISQYYLLATTVDAGSQSDTKQTSNPNTSGVDVVFADPKGIVDLEKDGKHSAIGVYSIKSAIVNIEKSMAVISDPWGEGKPYKNSIIRYLLNVTVNGDATAENVVIKDSVPEGTEYIPGSIKLNGNPLTDENDTDKGFFSENTVYVKLGAMTSKMSKQIITFDVKIK